MSFILYGSKEKVNFESFSRSLIIASMMERVIILGAGITGITVAFELKRRGYDIKVVDKGFLGSGSTGLSAGIVTPLTFRDWDVKVVRRSLEIYSELKKFYEFRMERTGFLLIGRSWSFDYKFLERQGFDYERTNKFQGFVINEDEEFIYIDEGYYIDPYDFIYRLALKMEREGVEFDLMNRACGFVRVGSHIDYLETEKGKIKGGIFVATLGAWTKKFLGRELPVPLKPYRTQMGILLKDGVDLPTFHDLRSGIYGRPESKKGVIVGDGTERREQDPDKFKMKEDMDFVEKIASVLSERTPNLSDAGYLRGWAGLCTASPGQIPLVFKYPDVENLYIISGMNGLGIMRAPAIAEIFASRVIHGEVLTELTPVNLDEDFEIEEGFSP